MASLVQSKTTSFTGTALQTASFASAPTQGSLLVAVITGNASVTFSTTPFGATADRERVITSQCAVRIYSKVAGASESADVTAQWSSASSYDVTLYEFSPTSGKVWDSTRIDQTTDNVDAGSGVTSLSTGTTSATTVADDVVVGAVGHNGLSGAANTATNSFTAQATPTAPLRGRVAHLLASSTGTQETTLGWTTARRAVSAIVAYKQTASAITGSISASVPRVTSSITGTAAGPAFTGTLTAAVIVATATITGTVAGPVTGSLSSSTPVATASISGTVTAPTFTGTLNAATPLATAATTGTVTAPSGSGTLAGTLPLVVSNLAGTVAGPVFTGTLAGTTPVVVGNVAGVVAGPSFTGTLTATVPKVTATLTGTVTAVAAPEREVTASRLPAQHTATRLDVTTQRTATRIPARHTVRRLP